MEYIFYLLPKVNKHEKDKYCYSYEEEPNDIEDILSSSTIEEDFEKDKVCKKCAFYLHLWHHTLILEKHSYIYSNKSLSSKYALSQLNIQGAYPNINIKESSLQYVDEMKVKESLQSLMKNIIL